MLADKKDSRPINRGTEGAKALKNKGVEGSKKRSTLAFSRTNGHNPG